MELTTAEITGFVTQLLWPFFRIAGMVMAAPIFSSNFVTTRTRMAIALAIAMVVIPTIPYPMPTVSPMSSMGILIVMQQVLIGICIGFLLRFLFNAFIVAGQIIAMQMGLGFASMVDPQNGVMVPVISQLYLIVLTLVFVTIDGHLVLIQVLSESFQTMPVSTSGLVFDDFYDIASLASWMYAAGVIIALPAIGSLLMVNLAFGILSRAAPQISPFSIGFPLTILMGFIIMMITLPQVGEHIVSMSDHMLSMARLLIQENG
jgi:flagellar biosynthetic protein FliR